MTKKQFALRMLITSIGLAVSAYQIGYNRGYDKGSDNGFTLGIWAARTLYAPSANR